MGQELSFSLIRKDSLHYLRKSITARSGQGLAARSNFKYQQRILRPKTTIIRSEN